jgi:hypothetical protein
MPSDEAVDGEGVSQVMESRPLATPAMGNSRSTKKIPERAVDRLAVVGASMASGEEYIGRLSRPEFPAVRDQSIPQRRTERYESSSMLPGDREDALDEIHILDTQAQRLCGSQPAGVVKPEKLPQDEVTDGCVTIGTELIDCDQELSDLGGAEDPRNEVLRNRSTAW